MDVLIVDDDVAMRDLIKFCTFKYSPQFYEAGSFTEALKIINSVETFDIAILAHNLPGRPGFDLIKHVKGKTRNIVLFTADGEDDALRKKAFRKGAYFVIPKTYLLDFTKDKISEVRDLLNTQFKKPC